MMSCVLANQPRFECKEGQEKRLSFMSSPSLIKLDRGVDDAWRNLSYALPDVKHVSVSSYMNRG